MPRVFIRYKKEDENWAVRPTNWWGREIQPDADCLTEVEQALRGADVSARQ